jgi:monoamine oxidase
MDACVRVVLDFKKNFWGEDAGYIWGGTTAPQYFSAGVGRSQFYRTLSITVCGPKAAELSALGADMITPILSELDSIYNGQATAFIRRDLNTNQIISFIQDWTKEEFIQGGFSYAKPGATNQTRIDLAAPVSGKLFFAGEATDIVGEAGTVSGALNSAERVSDDVIKTILGVS